MSEQIILAKKLEELTEKWSNFYSKDEQEKLALNQKMQNMEMYYKNFAIKEHRPIIETISENTHPDKAHICEYLRKGNIHPSLVRKSAITRYPSEGQEEAVISSSISSKIIAAMAPRSPIRQLASVEEISTDRLDVLVQEDELDCHWLTEDYRQEYNPDIHQEFSKEVKVTTGKTKLKTKQIFLHELYTQPSASQRLLDEPHIDVENWLSEQISKSFAKKENHAFLFGDGVNKPYGIFPKNEELGGSEELEDADSLKKDGEKVVKHLEALVAKLDSNYQHNATFLMHSSTLLAIQHLQSNGRFLWNPKIGESAPETLLGYRVLCSQDMPEYSKGSAHPIILFGDFKSAYKIVDYKDIPIMRDPYSNKPFVNFYAVKRVGGALIDKKALVSLKIKS